MGPRARDVERTDVVPPPALMSMSIVRDRTETVVAYCVSVNVAVAGTKVADCPPTTVGANVESTSVAVDGNTLSSVVTVGANVDMVRAAVVGMQTRGVSTVGANVESVNAFVVGMQTRGAITVGANVDRVRAAVVGMQTRGVITVGANVERVSARVVGMYPYPGNTAKVDIVSVAVVGMHTRGVRTVGANVARVRVAVVGVTVVPAPAPEGTGPGWYGWKNPSGLRGFTGKCYSTHFRVPRTFTVAGALQRMPIIFPPGTGISCPRGRISLKPDVGDTRMESITTAPAGSVV